MDFINSTMVIFLMDEGGETNLIKGKNPVNVLAGNVLRNSNFSLVVIAGYYLRRVVPQLFFTKRPVIDIKT